MIYVKIHEGPSGKVVAICDKELIGKVFSEGKFELKVSEFFYKGEEVNEEKVMNIIKDAENLNIIGERSINIALEIGVINKENIIKIAGVKHAQSITC